MWQLILTFIYRFTPKDMNLSLTSLTKLLLSVTACFCILLFVAIPATAQTKNGFDLSKASIPEAEIFQGGPPRDGIPSIDKPQFIDAIQAKFLNPDDRILGLVINDQAKAYPINIMNWHEIVNDTFSGQHISITFCPLCGTGMAFDTQLGEKPLILGVSGLLYQSDVLLYDRQTQSLWSQLMSESVNGPLKGQKLKQLPLAHTSWEDWQSRYPNTKVLSTETGYNRDYSDSPYSGYASSKRLYFDINHTPPAVFHPKELVLGIELLGKYKAYPFVELSKKSASKFNDSIAGKEIKIHWNKEARSAYITDEEGQELVSTTAFWFAWYTFHPETLVFKEQ